MAANTKNFHYRCERCGKRAIFGKHFCTDADVERAQYMRGRRKHVVSAIVAIVIIAALSWSFAGPYSILILFSIPIVAMIIVGRPRKRRDRYQELISIVGGDDALARRLVDAARKRFPDMPLPELVSYAIDKLQRDRNN